MAPEAGERGAGGEGAAAGRRWQGRRRQVGGGAGGEGAEGWRRVGAPASSARVSQNAVSARGVGTGGQKRLSGGCPFRRVPPDPTHGKESPFAVCPDPAHGIGGLLCRVPQFGPRQRAEAAARPGRSTGAAWHSIGRGRAARPAARHQSAAGLPCAYGPAHGKGPVCRVPRPLHTANYLTIFISIFEIFLNFVFKRFGILFHVLNFITFYHHIAKVIEKFMFYFDIVIISCV